MVLSDVSIRRWLENGLKIEPLDLRAIQPASIDMRLGSGIVRMKAHVASCIDLKAMTDDMYERVETDSDEPYYIQSREFLIAHTVEEVAIPPGLVGRLEGKSSLARVGLIIHTTAGYIDPGFKGTITLEIVNLGLLPVTLYEGMKIAQLSFETLSEPPSVLYGSPKLGSKYQGQQVPTVSRYQKNFEVDDAKVS